MKRYCYICGYETLDENITECPQCLCNDVFVQSKDEEELMKLFDDRKLTDAMLELKKSNLVEYQLKLQQLKNVKEQEKQIRKTEQESSKIKCPYCNSINVKRVTTTSKLMDTVLFGIFGTKRHKQWHCNNCNSDF